MVDFVFQRVADKRGRCKIIRVPVRVLKKVPILEKIKESGKVGFSRRQIAAVYRLDPYDLSVSALIHRIHRHPKVKSFWRPIGVKYSATFQELAFIWRTV